MVSPAAAGDTGICPEQIIPGSIPDSATNPHNPRYYVRLNQ